MALTCMSQVFGNKHAKTPHECYLLSSCHISIKENSEYVIINTFKEEEKRLKKRLGF